MTKSMDVRKPLLSVLLMLFCSSTVHAVTDWNFWAASETGYLRARDASLPPPGISEDLMANGRISLKTAQERIRLQAAAAQIFSYSERTTGRFVLREAFAVISVSSALDLSIGKKLVRWGTGAGYNPTGFADPPINAQDPNDRLSLNRGTELIQVNLVHSSHSYDAVFFSPRLFFTSRPLQGSRLALRYNRFWKGLDFSILGLIEAKARKAGANYSYVWKDNIELHGELAMVFPGYTRPKYDLLGSPGLAGLDIGGRRSLPLQSVFGGSYTARNGWTITAEWHHNDLKAVRQNKDTLFIMAGTVWGHERYSIQSVLLRNVQDGSAILIPGINAHLWRHWQVYLRPSFFIGDRKSEYGNTPADMILTFGLRHNL